MAERAADCLAKLGLDTVPPSQQQSSTSSGSPPNIADSKLANGGIIYSQSQNTASQQCPPTQPPFVREPLRVLGGRVSPPSVSSPPATSSAEASTASKLQPPNTGNVSNGTLSANSPNGPFNIHHRRQVFLFLNLLQNLVYPALLFINSSRSIITNFSFTFKLFRTKCAKNVLF